MGEEALDVDVVERLDGEVAGKVVLGVLTTDVVVQDDDGPEQTVTVVTSVTISVNTRGEAMAEPVRRRVKMHSQNLARGGGLQPWNDYVVMAERRSGAEETEDSDRWYRYEHGCHHRWMPR